MVSACCLSLSDTGICSIFHTCPSSVSSRGPSFRREIQGHCDAGMVSLMINAFHFLLGRRPDLRGGMRTSFFIFGLLFSFAAFAQTYPVSGVWVAMDYRFPQFRAGACLTLKTFGVDALFEGSFPTVTISQTASDLLCKVVVRQSEQSDPLRALQTGVSGLRNRSASTAVGSRGLKTSRSI
jgi:hypothetical protein